MEKSIATWGRRIRAFRKLKRLTQKELAERVHVSVFVLGSIERGERVPPTQLLQDIADALGISLSELKGEGSES